jgi:hypothetical protein
VWSRHLDPRHSGAVAAALDKIQCDCYGSHFANVESAQLCTTLRVKRETIEDRDPEVQDARARRGMVGMAELAGEGGLAKLQQLARETGVADDPGFDVCPDCQEVSCECPPPIGSPGEPEIDPAVKAGVIAWLESAGFSVAALRAEPAAIPGDGKPPATPEDASPGPDSPAQAPAAVPAGRRGGEVQNGTTPSTSKRAHAPDTAATRLRDVRLASGLSVPEVAALFDVTPGYWNRLEADPLRIAGLPLRRAADICKLFNRSLDELFGPMLR